MWGFPHLESAGGAVELDDLNFRRTSFPPGEMETIYCWICGLAWQCALDQ